MSTLSFDDLIPAGGQSPALSFDDLIPAAPPQGPVSASPAAAEVPFTAGAGAAVDTYNDTDRLLARYPAPPVKGAFEQLGDSFGVGVDQAVLAGKVINTTAQDAAIKRTQDRLNALEAAGKGMSPEAEGLRKTLDHYTKRQGRYVADVAAGQAEMANAPIYEGVRRLGQAKTFGEGWDILMSDPIKIIANLGMQSLPTVLPGVAAGMVNPALGAAVIGGSSAGVELGSSLLQFAADNGVDTRNPQALQQFYANPAMLEEAKKFAATRAGIIGLADAAGGRIAGKVLAPKSIKSPVARGVVNMAAQLPTQAATGAVGEAGAQLATKGEIDQPGEVVAEAAGGLFTAPAEVAGMATGIRREQLAQQRAQAENDGVPEQQLNPAQVLADTIQFNADRARTDEDAVARAVVDLFSPDNAQVQMTPERPEMPAWVAQGEEQPSVDFSDLVPSNMPAQVEGQMGSKVDAQAGPRYNFVSLQQMLPAAENVGNDAQQTAPNDTDEAVGIAPQAGQDQAAAPEGIEPAAAQGVPDEGRATGVETAGVTQPVDLDVQSFVAQFPEYDGYGITSITMQPDGDLDISSRDVIDGLMALQKYGKPDFLRAYQEGRIKPAQASSESGSGQENAPASSPASASDYEARVADLPEGARQRLIDLQRRMDTIGFSVNDMGKQRVIGMDDTLRAFKRTLDEQGEEAAMTALANTEERVGREEGNFFWNNVASRYIQKFDEVPKSDRQIKEAILSGGISVEGEPWADAAYRHYKVDPAKIRRSEAPADDPVAQLITRFQAGQFGLPRVAANVSDKQAMADAKAENKRFEDAYNEAVRRFLEGPMEGAVPTKGSGNGFSVAIGNDLTGISPQPVEKKIGAAKDFAGQLKAMSQIAAKKDIRFYLNGIMLDEANGRMAATDGHRLAVFYTNLKGRIPSRPDGVSGDVIVNAKGEWATDDSRGTRAAKPIDGKFPDIDRVIPSNGRTRDASASAAEIAAKARGIVKANKFVNAKNAFPITVQIDNRAYAFEPQYILDMAELFQRLGYERFNVNLGASDDVTSSDALLATSPDGKLQQIVMPKRWQDGRKDVDADQMFYAPIVLSEGGAVVRQAPVAPNMAAKAASNAASAIYGKPWTDGNHNKHKARIKSELVKLGYTEKDAEAILEKAALLQTMSRSGGPMTFLDPRFIAQAADELGLREPVAAGKAKRTKKATTTAPAESTAPEHATVGVDDRELGQIVDEFNEAQQRMVQDEERITHVFDPPAKSDVVRLEEKVRVHVRDKGWMTPAEAKAEIAKWREAAQAQGETNENANKVVLSLFDLTGQWSKPWEEAGYQVYRFDIQDDPVAGDVNNFSTEFFSDWFGDFDGQEVYAILAACPCTDFAVSGARHFAAKDKDGRTVSSVKLVHQTLATIEYFKPPVWAIENPVGRIESLGGLPPWRLSFNPNHLGDPYTKKTLLWGRFNGDLPIAPVEPTEGSKMHQKYGGKSLATKNARSVTPEGFAYGFFAANNAKDNPVMAVANKYDRLDRDLIKQALDAGLSAEDIAELVDDPYYMDLDDAAAEQALRDAIAERGTGSDPVAEFLADEGITDPQVVAAVKREYDRLGADNESAEAGSSENGARAAQRGQSDADADDVQARQQGAQSSARLDFDQGPGRVRGSAPRPAAPRGTDPTQPGAVNGRATDTRQEDRASAAEADGAEANQRVKGAGQNKFVAASYTKRQSVWRDAFADIGIPPTIAENLPPAKQLEVLTKGLKEKFGLSGALRSPRLQIREAIDQMLDAYRGMQFMANVLDLPSSAIGLKGKLGLALVRDGKGFLGAYTPEGAAGKILDGMATDGPTVIMPGRSNSFAHEWGHALDYFLLDNFDGVTDNLSGYVRNGESLSDKFPETIRDSFRHLMNALFFDQAEQAARIMDLERRIEAAAQRGVDAAGLKRELERLQSGASMSMKGRSGFYQSSKQFAAEQGLDPSYWVKPTEMLARSFEAYIAHKVEAAGGTTEFIAKGDYAYLDNAEERLAKTFPKDSDRFNIFRAYDLLFDAIRAEELLGSEPAATSPAGIRLSDPMIYFDNLRGEANTPAWKRAINEEIRAWRLRGRQLDDIASRPADTRSLAKRLTDPVRAMLFTNRGVLLAMMRQYRDNPAAVAALKEVFKRVATNPGAGWQTHEDGTFSEAVDRNFRRFQTRLSNIVRANNLDLMSDAERAQLTNVLTATGGEALTTSMKVNKAAAELRELVNDLYYYNRNAGLDLGFTENGYLPRLMDEARVTEEADQFIKDATKVYQIVFERDTVRASDEGVDVGAAIAALDERIREAKIDRKNPMLAEYRKVRAKIGELVRALNKAIVEGDGDVIDAAQAELNQYIEENMDVLDAAYDYVRDVWSSSAAAEYQTRISYGSPTDFSSHSPAGSFMKGRVLPPEADKILARYYLQNPVERISRYVDLSVRKAEYNRRFGATKKGQTTQLYRMLEALVNAKVRKEDRDMVEKIVAQVTGTDRSGIPNQMQRLLANIHAIGQMALLGRVVLTSLAEPITTAIQTGRPADVFKSLALTISEVVTTGTVRERRKLANVMGIVSGDLADEMISNRLGGNFGESGMMQRANAAFFRRIGLTGLTNAQRRAAMVLSGRYVLDLAHVLDDAEASVTEKRHARDELVDAGLTDEQIRDFVEWSREFDSRLPRADELMDVDGSLTDMGKVYSIMVGRLVNQSIQNPTAIDRPYAANTPVGRLVYGLLSFTMAFWRNVVVHAGKKATREWANRGWAAGTAWNAMHILTPMAALYAGHLLVTTAREAMLNPEKWEEQEEKGQLVPWLMSLAFSRSGFTGLADPLYNALTGVKYQRDLANIFTGPSFSFFAQAMQRIAAYFVLNSENTNSAERAAAQGVYELIFQPAMAFGVGYLPGGPLVGYGLGASYAYMSSPTAKDMIKDIVAGPKDGDKAKAGEGNRKTEEGF